MKSTEILATMTNQAVQAMKFTINPSIVKIKEYTENLLLAVCSLNHNFILNNAWCKIHIATDDHKTNKEIFKNHKNVVLFVPNGHGNSEQESLSTTTQQKKRSPCM